MSIYHFVMRSGGGEVEELGFVPLPDDAEAVAFGEKVILESKHGSQTDHSGSVMVVTDGQRDVVEIPFEMDVPTVVPNQLGTLALIK
jgi:hypothetical protein